MSKKQIKDIPSIKKNTDTLKGFKAFKTAFPVLKPILKVFGGDIAKVEDAFLQISELEKTSHDLENIPDKFNDLLSNRGWIMYELMDFETAKKAVEIAESASIDNAEEFLVDYYTIEVLTLQLRWMNGVDSFKPRMELARKALNDFNEGRYYASVIVVLALLDGMINTANDKRLGFFASNVNLEAYDSISAHDKGLNQLVGIMSKSRTKTYTEEITIPYRNGIMHGMDLNYDNKMVAVKTWVALFASKDWASKAENGLLGEQAQKTPPSWSDLFKQINKNAENKKALDNWKPRSLILGKNIPSQGLPEDYQDNTPERRLAEFMLYWSKKNYGFMVSCLSKMFHEEMKDTIIRVKEIYKDKDFVSFEIVSIEDVAAAVSVIKAKIIFKRQNETIEKEHDFRMINTDSKGNVEIANTPLSEWGIITWGL
jgi:hypothetical protein